VSVLPVTSWPNVALFPMPDRVVVDGHVRPVIDLLFMSVHRAKVAELVEEVSATCAVTQYEIEGGFRIQEAALLRSSLQDLTTGYDASSAQSCASTSGVNGPAVIPWCVPSGYVRPASSWITPKPGALILKSFPLLLVSTSVESSPGVVQIVQMLQ
jgi:hypothetical protein